METLAARRKQLTDDKKAMNFAAREEQALEVSGSSGFRLEGFQFGEWAGEGFPKGGRRQKTVELKRSRKCIASLAPEPGKEHKSGRRPPRLISKAGAGRSGHSLRGAGLGPEMKASSSASVSDCLRLVSQPILSDENWPRNLLAAPTGELHELTTCLVADSVIYVCQFRGISTCEPSSIS